MPFMRVVRPSTPGVSPIEREDRNDYNVQVHADLSRLNVEQLIALEQLALIASGGAPQRYLEVPIHDKLINEKVEAEQAKLARDYGARWGHEPKGP
jgi:hypothetical protein